MKIISLILRLIALPLWSGLILIASVKDWIVNTYWFARYGGEAITYKNKTEKHTIADKLRQLIKSDTTTH